MKIKASAVIVLTLILVLAIPVINVIALSHTVYNMPEQTDSVEFASEVSSVTTENETASVLTDSDEIISHCLDVLFEGIGDLFDLLKDLLTIRFK